MSNDVIAGNGREKFLISNKFSENILSFFKYCLNSPFLKLYILDKKIKMIPLIWSSLILKVAISSKLCRVICLASLG